MAPGTHDNNMTLLMEWMKRLEDKFDSVSEKLEEKNNSNYKKLEDKLDANYDSLEQKITEYIETTNKNIDSVKDKLQDHEYRLRSVEATSKNSNDKVIELLTKTIEKKDEGFIKKITKVDNVVIIVILVLIFVSGNFASLSAIIKLFVK